jgi:hypothetical protein
MSDELKPQSVDSREFRKLVRDVWKRSSMSSARLSNEEVALIAHINAWGARLAGVPDGWRLVPVEAPWSMLEAAHQAENCGHGPEHFRNIYAAMLAAAPTPDKEPPCGS